jgi:hypothetical protein
MSRKRTPAARAAEFSTAALDEAAREALALARVQGVRAAVAGGRALQWFGSDRFTRDVDIVAEAPLAGLRRVKPITFGGSILRASNGVTVDWIVRSDEAAALYQEALFAARKLPGCPYPVVPVEHLVAMKFGARRGRDLDDIAGLLGQRRFGIKRARAIIAQHYGWYVAKEFDNFVAETRWRRRAGISEGGRG